MPMSDSRDRAGVTWKGPTSEELAELARDFLRVAMPDGIRLIIWRTPGCHRCMDALILLRASAWPLEGVPPRPEECQVRSFTFSYARGKDYLEAVTGQLAFQDWQAPVILLDGNFIDPAALPGPPCSDRCTTACRRNTHPGLSHAAPKPKGHNPHA